MITSYDNLPDFQNLLEPDFENGKLYWKVDRSPKTKKGMEAGSIRDRRGKGKKAKPYCMVQCNGFANYNRGKILYFLKYGIWPPMIDHINSNSLDDRIKNLREITPSKNAWNIEYHFKDKDLPVGIRFSPSDDQTKPYRTVFRFYGVQHSIRTRTKEEAIKEYDKMCHQYFGRDLTIDYYTSVIQSSPEWHFLRQNRITGTSAYNLLRTNSIQETLRNLKKQKPFGGNYWTERGKTLEPDARDIYTQLYNADMHEVGAVINSKFPQALWSPDGLVGLEGAIEIKCLAEKNHFEVHKNISPQYLAQIQFGLFISERKWCDLINYNPDIEDIKQTFLVRRIYPDESIQNKLIEIFRKEQNAK